MFLTALFTVQPLIMLNAQNTTSSETGNSCKNYVTKQRPISRQKIKTAIPPQDVMLPPVVLYVSIYR